MEGSSTKGRKRDASDRGTTTGRNSGSGGDDDGDFETFLEYVGGIEKTATALAKKALTR